MAPETNQDSGLIRRGIFLLLLVGGIGAVVLWIIFQRPVQQEPPQAKQPEPFVASLIVADMAFPASLAWPALGMLAETLPSSPGWEVRYNAAAALGRRGSKEVPWTILEEMLDEGLQMRNFRVKLETGKVVPDEAAARLTVLSALRAVKQWHEKQAVPVASSPEMARVYSAVERLAQSGIVEVKKQAEEARSAIAAKKAS